MCAGLCFYESKQLSTSSSTYSALGVENVGDEFVNGRNTTVYVQIHHLCGQIATVYLSSHQKLSLSRIN